MVEGAVAVGEGGVREDAARGLADEGGADEAGWVGWREAEEDLADGVVVQLGRRRRHGMNGLWLKRSFSWDSVSILIVLLADTMLALAGLYNRTFRERHIRTLILLKFASSHRMQGSRS